MKLGHPRDVRASSDWDFDPLSFFAFGALFMCSIVLCGDNAEIAKQRKRTTDTGIYQQMEMEITSF